MPCNGPECMSVRKPSMDPLVGLREQLHCSRGQIVKMVQQSRKLYISLSDSFGGCIEAKPATYDKIMLLLLHAT